jgi:hypothetical protein
MVVRWQHALNPVTLIFCRSFHLLFFWVVFENVMSLHRSKATLIGLLEAGRANEWVVTEKLGNALKMKSASKANKRHFMKQLMRIWDRYGTKMNSSSSWYFLVSCS